MLKHTIDTICKLLPELKDFYIANKNLQQPWMEKQHYDNKWNFIWVIREYENFTNLEMPTNIPSAGFSILEPNSFIKPHRGYEGYSENIFRCHLTLQQSEDSGICVGGKDYSFDYGKAFWFDDSKIHYAWNFGTVDRVSFLFDVEKNGKIKYTNTMKDRHQL